MFMQILKDKMMKIACMSKTQHKEENSSKRESKRYPTRLRTCSMKEGSG